MAGSANANWQSAAVNPSELLVSMADRVEHYISGKGDAFKRQFYTAASTVDKREFMDLASGEHWVLVKADAIAAGEPGKTGSTYMTATIITYGLGGSLIITLLSLGFGFREFLNEC